MYSYAIIGFGGLGKIHLINLDKIATRRGDLVLKAICGASKENFKQSVSLNMGDVDISNIDVDNCNFYDDYKQLIDTEKPDFIISTLPTFMHEEVAVYALQRGIHVFSEKPMSLTLQSCERMIEASKNSSSKLMIGHCLRYDPVYCLLREYIKNKKFGKVIRAEFSRYSRTPKWTWNNWILDPQKSGGCIIDMHVHDTDLINWFFGMPQKVNSVATDVKTPLESVFTQYYYENGLVVTAGADWAMPQKYPFTVKCIINFENATVVLEDNKLNVYTDEEVFTPDIPEENCYEKEINKFLYSIENDSDYEEIMSIYDSMLLVMKEKESVVKNDPVYIN